MRNKWGLLLFVVLLASSVGFSQAVDKKKVSTEFYIKVKEKSFSATQSISSNVTISSELPFLRRLSNSNVQEAKRPFYSFKEYGINRVYRVSFSGESDIEAIYEQLKKDPSVELVERVYPRTIISTPNDSLYSSQWYLPKIKAPQAWDITVPAGEVIVAIVDNAFQVNHPDLAANMVAGRDVSDGDNDPSPPNTDFSHGTHVAGIVSAVTNNTIGISAAANNRVKIMPIKATPNRGDYRGIYHGFEGIAWAIVKGAKIISLSWGGSGFSQVEQDIINFAHANNILVIAAAGNNNNEGLYYPASYEHVISVASVDSLDKKSSFSSFGSKVDISAPGSSILSTLPYGNYFSYSGTSMATPLVASVCGYILSAYPTTLPNEMENLVKRTANDISSLNPSYLDMLGAGRVNMLSALACKSMLLDTLKLIASDTRVCPGDTITLTASIPDLSYNWYKDGVVISGDSLQQLSVNEKGRYAVKIKSGDCELKSEPLNITINNFSTPAATVNYIENLYCEDSTAVQKLVVQTEICELSGPNTYTYSGPMVGYDGGTSNGENLSVEVSRLDGGLSTLIVEIVWEKKDLYTSDNCDEPSGPNSAFYDEVSFKLRSPSGEIQAMIPANTYMSNLTSQGVLTTKFMIGGTALNILPYSGTFQPAGDFTKFMGEDPNGIWTLIADDDSFIDPLCVKGFSVTIETDAVDGPPVVSWWSAASGGSLFGTGSDFSPSTSTLGEQAVYVSAKCEGGCESDRMTPTH